MGDRRDPTQRAGSLATPEWLRIGTGGVVATHWESIAEKDDGPGSISGWASVFNVVDLQDDIVLHGAFMKTISDWKSSGRVIALTNGHDNTAAGVIGSVTDLKETAYGLKLAGAYSSAASAQDIRTKAKEGHVPGLSIYGPIIRRSFETRDGRDIQVIHEAGLFAVGLTPMPANTKALVTAAKALGDDPADDEELLSKAWICDMKAALAITTPAARKAAVDMLVRTAYPTLGEPAPAGAANDTTGATPNDSSLDDASTYALGIIGDSGPSASSPDGEPTDSLAGLLAADAAKTSRELEALAAELRA